MRISLSCMRNAVIGKLPIEQQESLYTSLSVLLKGCTHELATDRYLSGVRADIRNVLAFHAQTWGVPELAHVPIYILLHPDGGRLMALVDAENPPLSQWLAEGWVLKS